MGKLVEGLWDCPFCDNKRIRAGQKTCPSCGHPQDENTKFYMPDEIKYVSDEEFVKDCIQDLFVKLCSSTRLSPTDYVRSYLLTSLKNLIFDKLSSLKSTEDINALPFDLTIEDTSLEVLFKDNDEDIQMIKNLQEAYKQLSENQRMAIYLRYIKGLSYREVAAVLEINPQSAMNLVSRTLTSLRSKMTLKEYLFFLPFFLS